MGKLNSIASIAGKINFESGVVLTIRLDLNGFDNRRPNGNISPLVNKATQVQLVSLIAKASPPKTSQYIKPATGRETPPLPVLNNFVSQFLIPLLSSSFVLL